MKIQLIGSYLNGVQVFQSGIFQDERGSFMETFRKDQFEKNGLSQEFIQDNHSKSFSSVLRGLHFQWDPPMGKLMRVSIGKAFLVAVDLRKKSPYLGHWFADIVSDENRKQIWAPAGFARGFCVISDYAEIHYKCTAYWNPKAESSISWNDPQIAIRWPIDSPILSYKDSNAQSFKDWIKKSESNLF